MRVVQAALAASSILVVSHPAAADVKLPALFGNHMVVQRDAAISIWGTAAPGEPVRAALGPHVSTAKAGADGRWSVALPPLPAGGPHTLVVEGTGSRLEFADVLAGDVWICSGQSNMEWPLGASRDAETEVAAAGVPKIRLFTVEKAIASEPLADLGGRWSVASPETAKAFSAVGYFFGRDLHAAIGVPIGLVHSSWGGTPAESWTSRAALESDPDLSPIVKQWDDALAKDPKAAGNPLRASGLFNAMIAPLTPFSIRGAIWYQGESNVGRAPQYRKLFPAMIRDWRRSFGRGEFPFLFVQLANFMARAPEPADSDWAELREAQGAALALPNTGMAVAIDIGEEGDIHPRNKQDVGRRLALAARAIAHKERSLAHSGPVYRGMTAAGGSIRLAFDHADGGLAARGGGALKGFAIAGEDGKFVWADATIDGETVVVRSARIGKAAAVRYAWADNPDCNLVNGAGLPAAPFRTDSPGAASARD